MKCALCLHRNFSLIFESHHPIEQQPVIICWACFTSCVHQGRDLNLMKILEESRKLLQPNRCE